MKDNNMMMFKFKFFFAGVAMEPMESLQRDILFFSVGDRSLFTLT